jgi:seryl-tRNA synthetase
MELLEGLEDTERLTDETAKLEEKVESHLAKLNGWAKNIAGIQKQYEQVLPIGKGKQFDNFRSEMKKLEEWLRGNPEKWPRDYKDLPEVTKSFYDIPHEEYVRTERVKYSAEFIKYLADWLGLESQYLEVMETSKW